MNQNLEFNNNERQEQDLDASSKASSRLWMYLSGILLLIILLLLFFSHSIQKNADATNFITLHLEGAVTGTVQIKLLAGESYESTCNEIWDYTAAAWDKIYRINATSDTATCDVEFFYVSK